MDLSERTVTERLNPASLALGQACQATSSSTGTPAIYPHTEDAETRKPMPSPVRVEVWGRTSRDAHIALITARCHLNTHLWNIVEEVQSIAPTRTRELYDPAALAQGADYEWIWKAYRASAG